MRQLSHLLRLSLLLLCWSTQVVAADKPALMLAEVYQSGIAVQDYWVSEKLDGVRARWDGQRLISRGGQVFAAPTWFTQGFPQQALDGELWIARDRFADTLSVVRQQTPHDGWQTVKFMLFDLPEQGGQFGQRLAALRELSETLDTPYLALIEQFRVSDEADLMQRLQAVTAQGGEGLMLHADSAEYVPTRSDHLLKLKTIAEADAEVIGYRPGKGRFSGMVGSLQVRLENGIEFYIGSGLTKAMRETPPPIGSRINFRYQGLTKNQIPRFAVFQRLRDTVEQ